MSNTRAGLDTKHFEPVCDYRCKVCKTYFDPKCPNCNPGLDTEYFVRFMVDGGPVVMAADFDKMVGSLRQQIKDYSDMWDEAHSVLNAVGIPNEQDGSLLSLESRIKLLVAENTRLRNGLNKLTSAGHPNG